jgi:hypothetical protein
VGYTFDGPNRLIVLTPGTTDITVEDMWSRWIDWMLTSDNSKYLPAMRTVGGDPLSDTKDLGTTFFMLNGWRIRPQEANHWLTIEGNIYTDPSGFSPFVSTLGSYTVTIVMQVSNLSDATFAQSLEIQYSRYVNAVTVNTETGEPGADYPTGTFSHPVDNLEDARLIAEAWGFTRIKTTADLTIAAGQDVSGYKIESDTWNIVTVEPGAITTDTEFYQVDLYGEMSGSWNVMVDCWVEDVTNFLGWVRGGSIARVELAPYVNPDPTTLGSSFFDNLLPMYANIPSVLVMNDGTQVSFTRCSDMCEVHGMSDGSEAIIGLDGGKIIVDSSCSGGQLVIGGFGLVENNADPDFAIDLSGLNNPALIRQEVDETSLVRKLLTNKTVEDDTGVTLYDDDGIAVLGVWTWDEDLKTRGKLS